MGLVKYSVRPIITMDYCWYFSGNLICAEARAKAHTRAARISAMDLWYVLVSPLCRTTYSASIPTSTRFIFRLLFVYAHIVSVAENIYHSPKCRTIFGKIEFIVVCCRPNITCHGCRREGETWCVTHVARPFACELWRRVPCYFEMEYAFRPIARKSHNGVYTEDRYIRCFQMKIVQIVYSMLNIKHVSQQTCILNRVGIIWCIVLDGPTT